MIPVLALLAYAAAAVYFSGVLGRRSEAERKRSIAQRERRRQQEREEMRRLRRDWGPTW